MKKLLCILAALTLGISLAACSKAPEETTTAAEETVADAGLAGIANPMAEYGSLAEICEITGVSITKPETQGEISDEKFFVISGELAEYDFTVNGRNYTLRGSKDLNADISGLYTENGTAFAGQTDGTAYYSDETVHAARTVINETQYVLTVEDNGYFTDDQFAGEAAAVFGAMENAAE